MLSASAAFSRRAVASMRPLSWRVTAALDRSYSDSLAFFRVGISALDGTDILRGDSDVLQDWDRYQYDDYSDRLISYQLTRQEDAVSSVTSAMVDLVLDNHDGFFGAAPATYPNRPFRIYSGFGGENLPRFVGVSEKPPTYDDGAKTVSYHLLDFMSTLYERELNHDILLQNVRIDQALGALLQDQGLSPGQYDLDVSLTIVPLVFFAAHSKFGDAAADLMEAELGRLFMTESGRITFRNRQNYSDTPALSLDRSDIISIDPKSDADMINSVQITSNVRSVQPLQNIWQLPSPTLLPAGQSIEVFANFNDPVTSVAQPVLHDVSDSSYFIANTETDGSGTDVNIAPPVFDEFSMSYKMTFTNPTTQDCYITQVVLFGNPAPAVAVVNLLSEDADSIDSYGTYPLTITSDFIQTQAAALTKAQTILEDQSTFGGSRTLTVRGTPAMQIGDSISAVIDEGQAPADYKVVKCIETLSASQFKQAISLRQFTRRLYFQVGISALDSNAVLAP